MGEPRFLLNQGRQCMASGEINRARKLWKRALMQAYEETDFAAAFVLSKNLGDIFYTKLRMLSNDNNDRVQCLDEAKLYYQYALSILDQCELRQVLNSPCLLQSVVHQIDTRLHHLQTYFASTSRCTTCHLQSASNNKLVLDQADGCFYCQQCYDEYYASIQQQSNPSVDKLIVQISPKQTIFLNIQSWGTGGQS